MSFGTAVRRTRWAARALDGLAPGLALAVAPALAAAPLVSSGPAPGPAATGQASPLRAQEARLAEPVAEQSAEPLGELVAELPLLAQGPWLVVPVEGRAGDTLRFILDTGATIGAVSRRVAERYRLRPAAEMRVSGASGFERLPVVEFPALRLDGVRMRRHRIVLPDDALADAGTGAFDGLIGADLLDRYDVLIDAPAGTLRLYRSGSAGAGGPVVGPEQAIPFERVRRRLVRLVVRVNGHPVPAILDSGSPSHVLSRAAAELAGAPVTPSPVSEGRRGVGWGAVPTHGAYVDRLEVGPHRIDALAAEVADLSVFDRLGFGSGPVMLLGAPLLRECPVLISWRREMVRVCRDRAE